MILIHFLLSSSFRKPDRSHESPGGKQPSDLRRESGTSEDTSASDPGLHWFHSLTSPADGKAAFPVASPIRSSTQYHTDNTPGSSVLPSNSGSTYGECSAWEKEADEDGSSVVQKVSKKLRTKRLKEMNTERSASEGKNTVDETINTGRESSPHTRPCHSRKQPSNKKATCLSPAVTERSESENLLVDLSSFAFRTRGRMTHTDQASASHPAPKRGRKIGTERNLQRKGKEKEKNGCCEQPAEGSSTCKKLRARVQAKVREIPSENRTADDAEHKRQQLVQSLSSATPNKPISSIQPCQPETKIASSTLAKLSTFSFVPSAEEKTSQNLTTAPTQMNNTPVSKDGVMEKYASAVKSAHTNTATVEQNSFTNLAAKTRQKTSRPYKNTEMCEEESESSRKRKCFESSSGRPGGLFSGLSFFGSSTVDDDALDVDWDEESGNKAKI